MKTCNDEWNAMKTAGTVGDKKYADFRKEYLAGTAASPAAAACRSGARPLRRRQSLPRPPSRERPRQQGAAVFPTAVSGEYASETAGKARMHTCLDQYNANKAGSGNGSLKWIQKGGGYYSECNQAGPSQRVTRSIFMSPLRAG